MLWALACLGIPIRAAADAAAPAAKPSSTTLAEAAASSTIAAGAKGSPILLERADRVEYYERERRAELSGNVRLRFEKNVIQADTIHVDLDRETISAEGHLVWDAEDLHATGSRMTFDTRSRTGSVDDVTIVTGPWICRGTRVEQPEENTVVISPGVLTTCVAPRPHYAIRCRTARIRLNRDLLAHSVTVLAGTTPVFWLPVLATPLRDFRLPFEAQVGRTAQLGPYVRTSPAYSFSRGAPGQVHVDYFARTGWGLGITQELKDPGGGRAARIHGYRIRERTPARPNIPRTRWEVFSEGSRALGPSTRVAASVDLVSDPHFREQYGNNRLLLPTTVGERRARLLVSRELGWLSLGVMGERVDTLHLTSVEANDGRYVMSSVHAPQVNISARPVPLSKWLSLTMRGTADRMYTWQNGWYVNSVAMTPSLNAFARIPGVGAATVTPRMAATVRDRGDRFIRVDTATVGRDINRGLALRAENTTSLRRELAPGLDLNLNHTVAKRLNKIGYDPYHYHGLDLHSAGGGLNQRFGRLGSLGATLSYDLRNKQDPSRRRWSPLAGNLTLTPHPLFAFSADTTYDLWFRKIRSVGGSVRVGRDAGGAYVRLRPAFTNNRLELPAATTTSQEYQLARYLYGASYQDSLRYRDIFIVDGEAGFPVAPGLTASALGQWDASVHRVHWYMISLRRDLHCWELIGTFQHYVSGENRFNASIGLVAFPGERAPLVEF